MVIEIPKIACVLVHGRSHETAAAFAHRHFSEDEILDMTRSTGEALLETLGSRVIDGRMTAIIEAGSPAGAHKLRVALASVARENYARRFGIVLPDAHHGEPNIDARLKADGYREVFDVPEAALESVEIRRMPMPTDMRHEQGPFDIIGDVHGCAEELEALLERLGYQVHWTDDSAWGRRPRVIAPPGRRAIFVGDLVDRGPRSRDVLAIVHSMVEQDGNALLVPGNHDVPLHNPLMRLLRPYSHYRAAMGEELEPARRLPDALVSGLNTVDPYVWQRGRLRRQSLERACAQPSDGVLHLVAMHHPPEHAPGVDKRRMRGAEIGLAALWECGVDVVLCGHLHSWRVQPVRTAEGVLLIQAGTGLSTRLRGEPNDLNVLDIDGTALTVTRHVCAPGAAAFRPDAVHRYDKPGAIWRRAA